LFALALIELWVGAARLTLGEAMIGLGDQGCTLSCVRLSNLLAILESTHDALAPKRTDWCLFGTPPAAVGLRYVHFVGAFAQSRVYTFR